MEELIAGTIHERNKRAITYALFRQALKRANMGGDAKALTRRTISFAYTAHQMGIFGGSILGQVYELARFDWMFRDLAPTAVVPTHGVISQLLAWASRDFDNKLANASSKAWRDLIAFVNAPLGVETQNNLVEWALQEESSSQPAEARLRRQVTRTCASLRPTRRWEDSYAFAVANLRSKVSITKRTTGPILIQCVNDNEVAGILKACATAGMQAMAPSVGRFVASRNLGHYGGIRYVLVQSGPGSSGPDAAQGVVQDAIDEHAPELVVAVGIAFALKDISVGRVVVATQVRNYERVRLGTNPDHSLDLRERGDVAAADPVIMQKARALARTAEVAVSFGEVVSGEKLVDHPQFRDELRYRFPDALAGEMEATGVAAAAGRRRLPWLLVKGISDRGDGGKKRVDEDAIQRRSATAAMQFVLHVGGHGGYS